MTAPLLSPNWCPAPARCIPLAVPAGLRLRGLVGQAVTLSWAPKSSADTLDFTLDPTDWLQGTGDYLASVSATVPTATGQTADLTVLWASLINGMACLFLGGGVPGTVQTVMVRVTTQQGRSLCQPVSLAITATGAATVAATVPTLPDGTPVPPNALALSDAVILTTESGHPYLLA
ncbi:hypothetical protein AA0313_0909 [Acetobacter indonesiensis NRIC 0313]|uniref:Uncharacterized protein n=1 Tax=Acetobacter indonesiensis TaxID=104101 RepID=A0A6N3T4F1_9PROT|nr:hypothetical protein [Acetobacter indonesiensis]GAN63202.1 hypothetical protein Abin_022_060 [Acetobacter indonesiensis]GBQ55624.1 hypothetical protein AA0313_0909 [Acetobacter indonesiensis NRIC 0313]GEN04151.1 hypothetical protein AIN02nite_21760 [Acetobacter indonesiensis]